MPAHELFLVQMAVKSLPPVDVYLLRKVTGAIVKDLKARLQPGYGKNKPTWSGGSGVGRSVSGQAGKAGVKAAPKSEALLFEDPSIKASGSGKGGKWTSAAQGSIGESLESFPSLAAAGGGGSGGPSALKGALWPAPGESAATTAAAKPSSARGARSAVVLLASPGRGLVIACGLPFQLWHHRPLPPLLPVHTQGLALPVLPRRRAVARRTSFSR